MAWTHECRLGEASNPGPRSIRFFSWNLGSLNTQKDLLLLLLHKYDVGVCLLQEHRVKPEAQARTARDLRSAGWQAFFGPPRACGFGEMILVHRRYSAVRCRILINYVLLPLGLRGVTLLARVYAPIKKRGPQEVFFGELAMWQDKPGVWFSGGDFNSNLLDTHPCSGHFGHTALGTWRSSV